MSDFSNLKASLLDEFGSSRVQPGIYKLGPLMYAIHLSQPSGDKPGSAYVSADLEVFDPESSEPMGKIRMMVGSVADKSKKRIMMAPSKTGNDGDVAGPPDVNPTMLLLLAKGGDEFANEEEESLFSGPFLLKAASVKQMKGNLTMFFDWLKKVSGIDLINGQRDGRILDGYVVELDSRPNEYPNKKKKKEGETEYDDDVLVPIRLIARPGEALPPGLFTGGAAQATAQVTQANPQTGPQGVVAGITQQPLPAPLPVSAATLAQPAAAQIAPTAPTGVPTAQQIELAIYQNLPADWATMRDFIGPLMSQFAGNMPEVLTYVQNPQWLYSPERALWESNPTQQLIKKRG